MVSPEVELKWYEALSEEHCLRIMELLTDNPSLLEVGWDDQPQRQVKGSWPNFDNRPKTRPWQARTALHVGAKRGCAQLVHQVMELLKVKDKEGWVSLLLGQGHITEPNHRGGGGVREDAAVCLRDLLLLKDGLYKLDALALTTLYGNPAVMILLMNASLNCDDPPRDPYGVIRTSLRAEVNRQPSQINSKDYRTRLRNKTVEFLGSKSGDTFVSGLLEEYEADRNFNFLSREEYFFHFTLSRAVNYSSNHSRILKDFWNLIAPSRDLLQFLLELRDGQGRSPIHVAVDNNTIRSLSALFALPNHGDPRKWDEEALKWAMTMSDGAGRTAMHRAFGKGHGDSYESILDIYELHHDVQGNEVTVPKLLKEYESLGLVGLWCPYNLKDLTQRNGFYPDEDFSDMCWNPVFSASIRDHTFAPFTYKLCDHEWTFDLLEVPVQGIDRLEKEHLDIQDVPGVPIHDTTRFRMGLLEFAVLVDARSTVNLLLKEKFPRKAWKRIDKHKENIKLTPIHVAALTGNYEMLKLLLDDIHCNPYVKNNVHKTALHCAMAGKFFAYLPHLLDYVDCEQLLEKDLRRGNEPHLILRKGCINLLLQAGCDIFEVPKYGRYGQLPQPGGDLKSDVEFLSWWYKKQAKEFISVQGTLTTAANAISVTAALVATASFVGPLQPPLGLTGHFNDAALQNIWVRIFIVCDSLSFYLAIAAIVFSLVPSIPMPEQSMIDEIHRNQTMVAIAVGILFPSIIFVLAAFASSSIAIIDNRSHHNLLTIVPGIFGGIVCLVAFFFFAFRLLGFVFPKYHWIKSVYKVISSRSAYTNFYF